MILKFEDGASIENANISIEAHVCTIKERIDPNMSGFKVFGDYNVLLVDGKNFTTLYRELSDGFQLSDDGSHYIPPEPVPPTPPKPSRLDILEEKVYTNTNDISDNSEGLFDTAEATSDISDALFELADYVAELEARIVELEESEE